MRLRRVGRVGAHLGYSSGSQQTLGEMRLQGRHRHTAIKTGVDLVARMGPTHGALGRGQTPVSGQGQIGGRIAQSHFQQHAFALGSTGLGAQHQGLEHRFAGHQRAAHVGKQTGGQLQAIDQALLGHIRQVMPRLFSAGTWCPDDGHATELRALLLQAFPAQAQLVQCGGPERGDEHIGVAQQALQHGLAGGGFEVGLHRSHPLVHGLVGLGAVVGHWVAAGAGSSRWGRGFELGAMRTHGLQAHQCGGAWQVQRQAEHTHTAQHALLTGVGSQPLG